MIRAAGILFVTADNLCLLMKRGPGSDHPGEYAPPGGQLEGDETPLQAAIRECKEETGREVAESELTLHTRSIAPAEIVPATMPAGEAAPALPVPESPAAAPSETVDYTTYLCRLKEPFTPVLCDESTGYAWAAVQDPPAPLHPGARVALGKLSWNELDIARAMVRGELTSPQTYHNVTLFAIRITGTGCAYRSALNEFVWRSPEQYLNQDFLDRCNGLPVIWEHPPKATLDSKEFGQRTVGSVFLPFIPGPQFLAVNTKAKADDVWSIAKLYDDETIGYLGDPENDASTSPTVVFKEPGGGTKMTMENGETILFEGTPALLDHVALCPLGVWDKAQGPKGVEAVFADAAPPPPRPTLDLAKLRAVELGLLNLNLGLRALAD